MNFTPVGLIKKDVECFFFGRTFGWEGGEAHCLNEMGKCS